MAKSEVVKPRARRTSVAASRKAKSPVLDVKQAVAKAVEFFNLLVPDASGVSLEEVDRSGADWLITLGHVDKLEGPLAVLAGGKSYKVIRIDGKTGEAMSMKMRMFKP